MSRREMADTRALERGLVALRWMVVAFGVVQAALLLGGDGRGPRYRGPLCLSLVVLLALGNVLISPIAKRSQKVGQLRRVGALAFALDMAVVTGLSTAGPGGSWWALVFVPPLEGAVRFGLIGALMPVGVSLASEIVRGLVLSDGFGHRPDQLSAVGTRLGVEVVVAVVAGTMARSLATEADRARARARRAEETAGLAESAAEREARARRELSAFHTAVLAGVSAEGTEDGIQSMADAVGRDLRCSAFAVLLFESDPEWGRLLVARGVHGDPGYARGARFPPGTALGEAAAAGRPVLHLDPPEGIVPLRVGGEAIGILHERASTAEEMDRDRLLLFGRLADQIALVAQAAHLRARQQETLRRLQELDEMKSDFVAITSHELRTPLAAIRGFVNTLRRRMDQLSFDEVHEFLGIVDTQTDRLIRLVEDLLVVSRIEAGKLTLRSEEVELDRLFEQIVRGLADEGRVEVHHDQRVPPTIIVDPQWLYQVLTNLLQNALKFSPADRSVELYARPGEDDSVTFAVSDRGPGIPAAERTRVFERFHQTDAASTRRSEGVGLGLYISKQIVDAMGGRIELDSEEGRGSTFTVTIPVRPRLRDLPAPARVEGEASVDRTAL